MFTVQVVPWRSPLERQSSKREVIGSSRFDGPIHPMADLEMFFPMNFFE